MKTIRALLVLSGVGIIGYAVYRYYAKQIEFLNNFTYKVIGIKAKSIKADNITLEINTRITNNSNVEAKVTEIFLDAFLNKVAVGNITEVKDIYVKANGSSDFSFNFSFNPKIVLGNLINIVTLSVGIKDVIFAVDGYVRVESGFIKTTIPFEYENNLKSLIQK
jgi:LEA14-like dessication related protein